MKRKDYLKPTMRVVKLRHIGMLMVSGKSVNLRGAGVDESEADDNGTNIW